MMVIGLRHRQIIIHHSSIMMTVACVTCPYLENYELLWDDRAASGRFCVKLWCCAGPELQVRQDGPSTGSGPSRSESSDGAVVIDEYFDDVSALYERAEVLHPEHLAPATPNRTARRPPGRVNSPI